MQLNPQKVYQESYNYDFTSKYNEEYNLDIHYRNNVISNKSRLNSFYILRMFNPTKKPVRRVKIRDLGCSGIVNFAT